MDTEANVPILAAANTLSEFEMAVLATQARASIGRLREFIKFQPAEDRAMESAMNILASIIPDQVTAR